jgi:uncharacterized protein YndB with AHSA1/START domain
MTPEKEWLTIREAMLAAGVKSPATVYRVLEDNPLIRRYRVADKSQRIHALDFLTAMGERVPGRPRGSASHNRRRKNAAHHPNEQEQR